MSEFCDCKQDGWCPRYGREMSGRFREICAGINCDLGTAAAFRESWSQEYENRSYKFNRPPTPLILKQNQAIGDAVVMTAAIYSLHKAHPGKYLTAVETPYPEVFHWNPYIVPTPPPINSYLQLQMHYPAIHQSNQRGIHFMQGWCEHLSKALGVHIPLLTNRPHLYFDYPQPPTADYWVICSGGKKDFTNKLWGFRNYAKVLSILYGHIKFVQVGDSPENHPRLHGADMCLVGKTNLRQLFDLVRASRGVVCGVSLLMHVAAALEKPAIVIAGGREPVQWNSYSKQHYLHTVGAMDCTSPQGEQGACWRSRLIPLGDNKELDENPCLRPGDWAPECMEMISPQQVADLVLMYNEQYEKKDRSTL